MKELEAFDSRFDAGFLTQLLDEKGIPWIIQADDGSGMFPTNANLESVKVYVSEEDYPKALRVIEEEE